MIILGDGNVGKTSIINNFVGKTFARQYLMTIGADFHVRSMTVDGEEVNIQIWDIPGQERFSAIRKSFYIGSKGVLLVYDITNSKSFNNLQFWIKEIRRFSSDSKIIIIGNKIDLQLQRTVDTLEAQSFASENDALYVETSAKTGNNINLAFEKIVRYNLNNLHSEKKMVEEQTLIQTEEIKSTLPSDLIFNKDILIYDSEQGFIK